MNFCIPVGLRCEFLENPLGLETQTPRLSWRLDDPRKGARQTACRIVAASSADKLELEVNPDSIRTCAIFDISSLFKVFNSFPNTFYLLSISLKYFTLFISVSKSKVIKNFINKVQHAYCFHEKRMPVSIPFAWFIFFFPIPQKPVIL